MTVFLELCYCICGKNICLRPQPTSLLTHLTQAPQEGAAQTQFYNAVDGVEGICPNRQGKMERNSERTLNMSKLLWSG